jgi:hypothetical protein
MVQIENDLSFTGEHLFRENPVKELKRIILNVTVSLASIKGNRSSILPVVWIFRPNVYWGRSCYYDGVDINENLIDYAKKNLWLRFNKLFH